MTTAPIILDESHDVAIDPSNYPELTAALENMPVLFGLVAQGHIPTIENMLTEHKSWEEISDVIGWVPGTAKEHYDRYLATRQADCDCQPALPPMLTITITTPTFAANLRAAIEKTGHSITEVAKRASISRQSLTFYLSGAREPTFAAACKLADACGVRVDRLR